MIAINRSSIAAAVLVTSASLLAGTGALAQTATNLNCKGCISKKDLGKKAVTRKALRNKAVTAKKIKNNSVKPQHMDAAAKPAGVQYDYTFSPAGDVVLDSDYKPVNSIKILVPGPGYVMVNADYSAFDQFADSDARCKVRHNGTDAGNDMFATLSKGIYVPAALVRTVQAKAAGVMTIELACSSKSGAPRIKSPSLTALFVPNRY
jgi:hypothetical protein